VKLNGNWLLRDFLVMDNVRALGSVLEQEVQLMVNIAPPKMDDKFWLMNKRKFVSQSALL